MLIFQYAEHHEKNATEKMLVCVNVGMIFLFVDENPFQQAMADLPERYREI